MSDLLTRFARSVIHRHSYVDDICEFCKITTKECQHEDCNVKTSISNGFVTKRCECGKISTNKCEHLHIRTVYAQDDSEYDYCEDCDKVIEGHIFGSFK